jgi:Sigma-70 region 2
MPVGSSPDVTGRVPGVRPGDARDIELSLSDPDGFGAVFDRYFAEIHGYAARRVGRDAADDIAAETFLTAFRVRRRFDPGRGTVKAWLYGIVTNHLSVFRRQELRAYRAMARAGVPEPDEGHASRVVDQVAAEGCVPRSLSLSRICPAASGRCCCLSRSAVSAMPTRRPRSVSAMAPSRPG